MKKITTVLLLVTLLLMTCPVVFAEEYNFLYTFEDLNESGNIEYTDSTGTVHHVKQPTCTITPMTSNPVTTGKFYISVDTYWGRATGTPQQTFQLKTGAGGSNIVFGTYASGLGYESSNSGWQANEGIYVPALNTCVQIEMLLDFDAATITYYKDGDLWGTGVLHSNVISNGLTGITMANGADWWIDNLVMSTVPEVLEPKVSQLDIEHGYVEVDFSAPLSKESEAAVIPEYVVFGANDAVPAPEVTGIERVSAQIYRVYYSTAFAADAEYYLTLPTNLVGKFGQKVFCDKVYFSGADGSAAISDVILLDVDGVRQSVQDAGDGILQIQLKVSDSLLKEDLDLLTVTANGNDAAVATRTLENGVYTMTLADALDAGAACTVEIPQTVLGLTNARRSFATSGGRFEVKSFVFQNAGNTDAMTPSETTGLKLEILNSIKKSEKIYLFYGAYSEAGKMTSFSILPLDMTKNYLNTTIEILPGSIDTTIQGFLIEEIFDGSQYVLNPITDNISLSN